MSGCAQPQPDGTCGPPVPLKPPVRQFPVAHPVQMLQHTSSPLNAPDMVTESKLKGVITEQNNKIHTVYLTMDKVANTTTLSMNNMEKRLGAEIVQNEMRMDGIEGRLRALEAAIQRR